VANAGGQPGLYGGTMNAASCDPQQIASFLAANPDKAAAWVAALNADPNVQLDGGRRLSVPLIAEYLATLTPVVLREDTRVTNHGFSNGRPTVLPSTLQKGTAVLVDKLGVPRVKCYCGNPLLPPVPAKGTPTYLGAPWPDFNPANVTVIQQNTTVINVFVLTDIKTGNPFERPAGSTGANDRPSTGVTATPPTQPAVTAAPGVTPPTSPAPTAAAAPTTAPPVATAPPSTPTASVAPGGNNPSHGPGVSVSRDLANDARCASNFGPGVQGYFVDGSYTDPDGDAGVVLTADYGRGYEDASPDTNFAGDGRTGTYRLSICGTPGESYGLILGDRAGNGSGELRFTVP
jgi:hypothetical protein